MAATMDLSGIHGSNGAFDFSDGAQFEVEVKKGTKIISGIVIVGAGPTTFAKEIIKLKLLLIQQETQQSLQAQVMI